MIEIKDLNLSFGEKVVFNRYSVALPDEGVVVIMGDSGVGKTSLMRVMAGLLKPQSVTITGMEGRKISFAFQEARLLEHMTALKNVSLVSDVKKATEMLTALGMKEEMNQAASKLSGGQKQRVSLARALAFDNDIVFLDEPFAGLDPANKALAVELISSVRLAIIVSHDEKDCELLPNTTKIRL